MPRPPEFDRTQALRRAMELFWKQGYEATSVHELGTALGLKPGSLYNAFKDKHSLYLEALDCYAQMEGANACALFGGTDTGKAAIRRFFEAVVDADVRDVDRKGCLMVNSAAELAARDPQVLARTAASRAAMQVLFQRAIVQAQHNNEIDPHRDPDALAAFLVNCLFGLRITSKTLRDRAALMAIVESTLQVL